MFLACLQIADEKIIRSECSQLCSVSPFSCNPPSVLKYVGSLARTLEQASLRAVWWPENPVISSLCGGSMSHPALKMLHSPRWVLLLCIDNEVLAIYDHVSLKVLSHILVRPPPKQRLCFSPFRMELIEPPQSCLHHSPSVSVPCDKAEGVLLSFRMELIEPPHHSPSISAPCDKLSRWILPLPWKILFSRRPLPSIWNSFFLSMIKRDRKLLEGIISGKFKFS